MWLPAGRIRCQFLLSSQHHPQTQSQTFLRKRPLVDKPPLQRQHFAHRSCIRRSPTRPCGRYLEPRRLRTCCPRHANPPARHLEPCLPSLVTTGALQFSFATSTFCVLAITCQRDRRLYFYKTNNYSSQGLCPSGISSDRELPMARLLPLSTPVQLSVAHGSPNNPPPSARVYHERSTATTPRRRKDSELPPSVHCPVCTSASSAVSTGTDPDHLIHFRSKFIEHMDIPVPDVRSKRSRHSIGVKNMSTCRITPTSKSTNQ